MMNNKIMNSPIIVVLMLALLAVWACPQNAHATPPKDVKLSYDSKSKTLTVTITHYTLAQNFHYIKYVEIKKNGALISNNKYDNQPTSETFTYTYTLPAAEKDALEVTATCNMWGSKISIFNVAKNKSAGNGRH